MDKLKFPTLIIILILVAGIVAPRLQTVEAAPLAQEVPPNDNFADTQLITEMPFSASVDISLATAEENEPTWCVEEWANQTVWYTFTPTTNGRLTMMSSGADFRTFSAVFRLDEYGNLVCMGCEPGNLSPTSLNLQAGVTYYIQTGTWYPNSQGMLNLQVSWQPAPANDNFADAAIISDMPFWTPLSNNDATTETGEPTSGCSPYGSYHTVWYVYTPVENGQLSGDIATSFEAFLSVYQANGPSLSDLSELTCVYQDSNFWLNVTEGTTYYFQLGSRYEGSTGDAYLNLNFAPPPANDNFADAKVVDTMPYQDTVYTTSATGEPDEPAPCSDGALRTIWYAYSPAERGVLTGNAIGDINSFLAVYTGSAVDNLTAITCTNYDGTLHVVVEPGTTYYIQLGSMADWSYGNDTIYLSFDPAPPNDNFANAKIVTGIPYQDTVNTLSATGEPGEPASCSDWGYGAFRTVWYAYTATEKGVLSGDANGEIISFLAVYTGSAVDNLTPITCTNWDNPFQFTVAPGTTYYLQLGSLNDWYAGNDTIRLSFTPAPPNDDFTNAMVVESAPFSTAANNTYASTEASEPVPDCTWGGIGGTLWYAYTPSENGSITFQRGGFYESFIAVYTGSSLSSLTLLNCVSFWGNRFTLPLDAGVTYYIQHGSAYNWVYGDLTLDLYPTPPPYVDFWLGPDDPSRYDNIDFCDNSYDPGGIGLNLFWWDFGDGTQLETGNSCVSHNYPTDGDYTVWYKAQTVDGRSAETTRVIPVRTHDVAITKFSVPQAVTVGQTRPIVIGIRNTNYPENVTVELYKSTPNGFVWVGVLTMEVPVRPSNRTTDFKFSYTFANEDGLTGSVTFRAVATLNNARDAVPGDNSAKSLPTKVKGYVPGPIPYSATPANPANVTEAASTAGLLALGLVFGLFTVRRKETES